MKIGIIGSGLQCSRRIESFIDNQNDKVALVVGINDESLARTKKKYGISISKEPKDLFENEEIEAVLICTPPSSHYEFIRQGMLAGKKILVEKPISKNFAELEMLIKEFGELIDSSLRVGFNHRFHPALQLLKKYLLEQRLGDLLFVRSIYGISARKDYPQEWRANPIFAAGGQFIEQGSHVIDLMNWLIGRPTSVFCKTSNQIFENQPLDDGGMAILQLGAGVHAQMHTTLAQWHNKFEFEVYGKNGFARVSGLGNTYGTETFEFAPREENAPFNSQIFQFRGSDKSWTNEWVAFKKSINGEESDIGTFKDACTVMKVMESAYESDSKNIEISVSNAN